MNSPADLQKKAQDHLWMHFTRQSVLDSSGVPVIVRGEGHHIWDDRGKRYFDGLSGLFVVNAGHGRKRLAQAAAKQAEELKAKLEAERRKAEEAQRLAKDDAD